ncbi:MAG: chromate efflux transporter [Spiribacter salinus]|uniref:Chromate efflux transporter n=1 Tax=Spiribacter salinus TaxID=1335746 RepID=A0A540VWF8_9GAMM|nr:MAG: chromate efflux transporter [Spiribacter salinus]
MQRSAEIFWVFLRLGCIAFGGPVAHLGYYRRWFVDERQWLTDAAYAQLMALSHMLPGPSSSQTGFAIGLHRGGLAGGLAAWVGFTLPSAVIMIAFGVGTMAFAELGNAGWLQGLKLAAIAVVANALYGMARQLCPDRPRALIALGAAMGVSFMPGIAGQVSVIVAGGLVALLIMPPPSVNDVDGPAPLSPRIGIAALALFGIGVVLVGLPVLDIAPAWTALYRSGALVFGGGHVVLPLLESGLVNPGIIEGDRFLAGYGLAQAVPGPVFTFGGYLGTQALPDMPIWAGLLGVVTLFAPGLLLMAGLLPFWGHVSRYARAQQALLGINAAVVGLLAAVLWDPLLTGGIRQLSDAGIAGAALAALSLGRVPAYLVVAACAALAQLLTYLPSG